jgi:hypothetical protein
VHCSSKKTLYFLSLVVRSHAVCSLMTKGAGWSRCACGGVGCRCGLSLRCVVNGSVFLPPLSRVSSRCGRENSVAALWHVSCRGGCGPVEVQRLRRGFPAVRGHPSASRSCQARGECWQVGKKWRRLWRRGAAADSDSKWFLRRRSERESTWLRPDGAPVVVRAMRSRDGSLPVVEWGSSSGRHIAVPMHSRCHSAMDGRPLRHRTTF